MSPASLSKIKSRKGGNAGEIKIVDLIMKCKQKNTETDNIRAVNV